MTNDHSNNSKPNKVDALNAAFDATGLSFLNRGDALEQFQQQSEIFYSEDGEPSSYLEGVRRPLSQCLAEFGLANQNLIDGRALPRARCKADLKTFGEKSAFIRAHGGSVYELLPLTYTEPKTVETWTDWRKLTTAQKSALIKQDPQIQSRLKHDGVSAHPFSAKVNTKGLEKIAELRKRSGRSAK